MSEKDFPGSHQRFGGSEGTSPGEVRTDSLRVRNALEWEFSTCAVQGGPSRIRFRPSLWPRTCSTETNSRLWGTPELPGGQEG